MSNGSSLKLLIWKGICQKVKPDCTISGFGALADVCGSSLPYQLRSHPSPASYSALPCFSECLSTLLIHALALCRSLPQSQFCPSLPQQIRSHVFLPSVVPCHFLPQSLFRPSLPHLLALPARIAKRRPLSMSSSLPTLPFPASLTALPRHIAKPRPAIICHIVECKT